MAFAAQSDKLSMTAWIVFVAAVVWAMAYDTFYAMVDRDDDIRVGIKSTAILFGQYDLAIVGLAQTIMLCLMMAAGHINDRGWVFFIGLCLAGLLVARQLHDCRHRDRDECFKAFKDNHKVGLIIFVGLAADYLFKPAGL